MKSVSAEFEPTADAPGEARATIRAELADALPAPALYDLLTIVTELVSNAVVHGDSGLVSVEIEVTADGAIAGEVSNHGEGRVEIAPLDLSRTGGLGLRIVDAIADHWSVSVGSSTRISFGLDAP